MLRRHSVTSQTVMCGLGKSIYKALLMYTVLWFFPLLDVSAPPHPPFSRLPKTFEADPHEFIHKLNDPSVDYLSPRVPAMNCIIDLAKYRGKDILPKVTSTVLVLWIMDWIMDRSNKKRGIMRLLLIFLGSSRAPDSRNSKQWSCCGSRLCSCERRHFCSWCCRSGYFVVFRENASLGEYGTHSFSSTGQRALQCCRRWPYQYYGKPHICPSRTILPTASTQKEVRAAVLLCVASVLRVS